MERNLLDTVSMLGLDIMFAFIALLSAVSAVVRVMQAWRDRMTSNAAADTPRAERCEEPSAGFAPPLSIGFSSRGPTPDPSVTPDWIKAWTRRDASPTTARRGESREHEAA